MTLGPSGGGPRPPGSTRTLKVVLQAGEHFPPAVPAFRHHLRAGQPVWSTVTAHFDRPLAVMRTSMSEASSSQVRRME